MLTALTRGAGRDAHHSLWAANASAKGYVSRQGLVFQAVPAMTIADADGADRYLHRLAGTGAFLTALGDRYAEEAARGRTPTARGVQPRDRPAGGAPRRRPGRRRAAPADRRRRRPGGARAGPRDGRVLDPPGDGGAGRAAARRAAAGGPARRPGGHRRHPGRTPRATPTPSPGTRPPTCRRPRSTRSAWTCWRSCRRAGSRSAGGRWGRASSRRSPPGCGPTRRCGSAPARRSSTSPSRRCSAPSRRRTTGSRTTTSRRA